MSNSGRWPTAITIHVSYFAGGILAGERQVSRAGVIHFAVRPFTNRDTRNWSNGKRACSAAEILPLGNLGSARSTGLIWLRPAIEYYVNITTDTVIVIIAPRQALLVRIHLRYVETPRLRDMLRTFKFNNVGVLADMISFFASVVFAVGVLFVAFKFCYHAELLGNFWCKVFDDLR